jgi:hypothetical protein
MSSPSIENKEINVFCEYALDSVSLNSINSASTITDIANTIRGSKSSITDANIIPIIYSMIYNAINEFNNCAAVKIESSTIDNPLLDDQGMQYICVTDHTTQSPIEKKYNLPISVILYTQRNNCDRLSDIFCQYLNNTGSFAKHFINMLNEHFSHGEEKKERPSNIFDTDLLSVSSFMYFKKKKKSDNLYEFCLVFNIKNIEIETQVVNMNCLLYDIGYKYTNNLSPILPIYDVGFYALMLLGQQFKYSNYLNGADFIIYNNYTGDYRIINNKEADILIKLSEENRKMFIESIDTVLTYVNKCSYIDNVKKIKIKNYLNEWKMCINKNEMNKKEYLKKNLIEACKSQSIRGIYDKLSSSKSRGIPSNASIEDLSLILTMMNYCYPINIFLDQLYNYPRTILDTIFKRNPNKYYQYICFIKNIRDKFYTDHADRYIKKLLFTETEDKENCLEIFRFAHGDSNFYLSKANSDITFTTHRFLCGFLNTGINASYRRVCNITPYTILTKFTISHSLNDGIKKKLLNNIIPILPIFVRNDILNKNLLLDESKQSKYNDSKEYYINLTKRNEVLINNGIVCKYFGYCYKNVCYYDTITDCSRIERVLEITFQMIDIDDNHINNILYTPTEDTIDALRVSNEEKNKLKNLINITRGGLELYDVLSHEDTVHPQVDLFYHRDIDILNDYSNYIYRVPLINYPLYMKNLENNLKKEARVYIDLLRSYKQAEYHTSSNANILHETLYEKDKTMSKNNIFRPDKLDTYKSFSHNITDTPSFQILPYQSRSEAAPAAGGYSSNAISIIIYVILLVLVLILIYHVVLYIKLKNSGCSETELILNMTELTH